MSDNLNFDQTLDNQANKVASIMGALAQVDAAISDVLALDATSGNVSATTPQLQRCMSIAVTGHTVARTLTLAAARKLVAIRNGGTGSLTVTLGTTSLTVAAGVIQLTQMDGTANGLWAFGGGSSGGGATTLAGLTDVAIASPSNGQLLQYDSASGKWKNATSSGGGSGSSIEAAFTTPAVASFPTHQNFSGSTTATDFTTAGSGVRLSDNGTAGSNTNAHRSILQAVPSSTAWTAIGRFRRNANFLNWTAGGMAIRDSVSGKSLMAGWSFDAGGMGYATFTADNTYGSKVKHGSDTPTNFWVKMVWDNVNLYISYSASGDYWTQMTPVPVASIFTPTHVGIGINPNAAGNLSVWGTPLAIDCLSWSATTP